MELKVFQKEKIFAWIIMTAWNNKQNLKESSNVSKATPSPVRHYVNISMSLNRWRTILIPQKQDKQIWKSAISLPVLN
jgi:hypothetical protein